jgi:hypothetical protein
MATSTAARVFLVDIVIVEDSLDVVMEAFTTSHRSLWSVQEGLVRWFIVGVRATRNDVCSGGVDDNKAVAL